MAIMLTKEELVRMREISPELAKTWAHYWQQLSDYLNSEVPEGKTEFRLVVNPDRTFYIHPLGKDGKTFDSHKKP